VPTWASALAPDMPLLTVYMHVLNPLTLHKNSHLKYILNVQTHHLELVEGQKNLHADPMEHARYFSQIKHHTQ
jgi:hypothetical protein